MRLTSCEIIAFSLLFLTPAFGASDEDKRACKFANGDQRIAGCTNVISDAGEIRGHAEAYQHRGAQYFQMGDFGRAFSDFDQAVRLDPKGIPAYVNRAMAYSKKKDYDRAIADYDQAIRIDPKHAASYFNRALSYQDKNDYDRAIADFGEAIRLRPDYTNAYIGRAIAYFDGKKDHERAIADFGEAIRLDTKDPFHYNRRGFIYLRLGRLNDAIADFDQAIRLYPKDARFYSNRCRAFAIANRELQQALADCNEALELSPKNLAYLEGRGFVYLRLGWLDDAIADYNAVLDRDSGKKAASLYGRGMAKLRKGDDAGSNADIAASKSVQSDIAEEFAGYGVK